MSHILVFSDSPKIREFYAGILKPDYEPFGIGFRVQAVSYTMKYQPHAVIIGCTSDRFESGIDLVRDLGKPYKGRVVFAGDVKKLEKKLKQFPELQEYFSAVLQKPVKPEDLLDAVNKIAPRPKERRIRNLRI